MKKTIRVTFAMLAVAFLALGLVCSGCGKAGDSEEGEAGPPSKAAMAEAATALGVTIEHCYT